eukprot:9393172-Karenia_brevis.AAC.1
MTDYLQHMGGQGQGAETFQLSCRSVWRPKEGRESRRSALGGRGSGKGLALFQLTMQVSMEAESATGVA